MLHVEDQVFGHLVEVLDGEVQAVEYTALEGGAEGVLALPLEVEGLVLRLVGSGLSAVFDTEGVEVHVAVVVDGGVITDLAVGNAVAEIVDPAGALHEVFTADGPGGAHAPEVTPAVFLVEPGGTVATEAAFEEVLVHVIVLQAGQEALEAVSGLVALHRGHAVQVVELVAARDGFVLLVVVLVLVVVVVVLVTEQGFQRMVAEAVVPVQELLERVVRIEVIRAAGTAEALAVADDRIVVAAVHVVPEAHVTLDGECEILQEPDVGVGLGRGGDALGEALVELGLPDGAASAVLRAAVKFAGIVL